jgi:hypothetical protein
MYYCIIYSEDYPTFVSEEEYKELSQDEKALYKRVNNDKRRD